MGFPFSENYLATSMGHIREIEGGEVGTGTTGALDSRNGETPRRGEKNRVEKKALARLRLARSKTIVHKKRSKQAEN